MTRKSTAILIYLLCGFAYGGFGPDKTFLTPQEAIEIGLISPLQVSEIKSKQDRVGPETPPSLYPSTISLSGYINLLTTEGHYPAHQSNLIIQPLVDGWAVIDDTNYVLTNQVGYWTAPYILERGEVYTDFVSHDLLVRSMAVGEGSETEEVILYFEDGTFLRVWVDNYKLGYGYFELGEAHLELGYDNEFITANANAYYHAKATEYWIKSYLPDWGPLDITVFTNDDFGACNAYYIADINLILFARRQYGCPNMAYASIIRHEYGHGFICSLHEVDGDCSNPRSPDFVDYHAYHEGMADVIAAFSSGTSCMGPDAFGEGTGCGRDINDDYIWPILDDDPHVRGKPLSGAYWDLYQTLVDADNQGEEIASALLLHSIDINESGYTPEIRNDVITIDTWLYEGEHVDMIIEAFSSHGL